MHIVELSKPLKAIPNVSYSPATDRVADIIKTCSVSATSYTTASGRYATLFLAPAEGWWPSATKWGPFGPPGQKQIQ